MKPEHPHKGELYLLSGIVVLVCATVGAKWPAVLPFALVFAFWFLFALFSVK